MVLDGPKRVTVDDLAGICNAIYWMATIQAKIRIGSRDFGRWDHEFLLSNVTLPAIEEAMQEIQKLEIRKNRLWNLVNLSDRKESDLPDIINALELHKSALCHNKHNKHENCTPSKCQSAQIDSTKVTQLHKCLD
jgi:hypothetical protein